MTSNNINTKTHQTQPYLLSVLRNHAKRALGLWGREERFGDVNTFSRQKIEFWLVKDLAFYHWLIFRNYNSNIYTYHQIKVLFEVGALLVFSIYVAKGI